MSDNMRWRYGDTNPVILAVDAATVLEIGDLVYLDTDDAKPASAQANLGSKTNNQTTFHSKFAGVAMQRSRAGDSTPVRVATTGVFEFDCAAATFEVGDLMGAEGTTDNTLLVNQQVVKVTATSRALGRCVKRAPASATSVLVDIVSTVVKGGPVTPA